MKVREFFIRKQKIIFESIVILVAALVPRLYGIGLFLTADEKNWMGRGFEFIKAFRHLDINSTLQTTHPGITTLWVTGLSIYAAMPFFGEVFSFNSVLKFAVIAQTSMAFVNSLLIVGIYLVLKRLISKTLAFIIVIVFAFDAYLVGFSKIVHVDAFLTGFLFMAVLFFILYGRTKSRGAYWGSVIFSALAILTKLPAIAVIPFAVITFITKAYTSDPGVKPPFVSARLFRVACKDVFLWMASLTVIVIFFWPSLWWVPRPFDNINQVRKDMTVATLQPHDMDDPYTLEAWHYPAAFVSKTNTLIQIGIVVLLIYLLIPSRRKKIFSEISPRFFIMLLLFSLIFTVEMTLGAKKGDRYVLPVFPVLILLGTSGIYFSYRYIFYEKTKQFAATLAGFTIIATELIILTRLGPYPLAYYNKLYPPNLSQELGWGEGLDQVAKYLDSEPSGAQVASWYPEELRALTKKQVLHINAHEQNKIGYVVLYRNMFGRSIDHWANDFIDEYYKKRKPDFTAKVNGLEYAWVYKKPVMTGIIGEILPGNAVVVEIDLTADNLSRIDVMAANYSGKVKNGKTTLRIRRKIEGPDLRSITLDNSELLDGGFTRFSFKPIADTAGNKMFIIFTTEGTYEGSAPTLRVAKDELNSSYSFIKGGKIDKTSLSAGARTGWIGLDWHFIKDGKEVSRLEIK